MANVEVGTPPPAGAGRDDEGLRAQRTFTALMRAMAEPGMIEKLAIPPGVPEVMWGIVAVGWLLSFWREPGQTPEPV